GAALMFSPVLASSPPETADKNVPSPCRGNFLSALYRGMIKNGETSAVTLSREREGNAQGNISPGIPFKGQAACVRARSPPAHREVSWKKTRENVRVERPQTGIVATAPIAPGR